MFKKTIKIITTLLIFMLVNKVYAYNYNLMTDYKLKPSVMFLHLDELDKAKIKVNIINKETKEQIRKSNIKFKIKNKDTGEYVWYNGNSIYITNEDGMFITENYLDKGNYSLEQIENQDLTNYLWNSSNLDFTVSEDTDYDKIDDTYIITLNFEMEEAKGGINVSVIGETYQVENNHYVYSDIFIPTFSFKLYAASDIYSNNNIKVYSKDDLIGDYNFTESNHQVLDLYFGEYYLIQTGSDLDNIKLNEPYYFEIKYQDKYTKYAITEIELRNYYPKAAIVITNRDNITNRSISNTKINIYTTNDELVYSGYTDSNGMVIVQNLSPILKDYYYIEVEASEGYILNNKKIYFELIRDNQVFYSEINNEMIKGTLVITKTDYETNLALSNALIGIYNENDELLYSEYTDELGKITISNILYGRYYYKEIEAPEGYDLNEDKIYFEIKTNGEIVEGNMTNEKTEVPNTNQNENYLWLFGSIILFLCGGVIIFDAKKK